MLTWLQDKEQALEQATQAALDASSAAEAQHAALAKQLASEKRDLQDQAAQVALECLLSDDNAASTI